MFVSIWHFYVFVSDHIGISGKLQCIHSGGRFCDRYYNYPSSDQDIYAAENAYTDLENALNQQINEMESKHPGYDEYKYNIAEIGHDPYHLISYLTARYGDWTYEDVENESERSI